MTARRAMRTQVAIVGAGPAGLVLAQLLHLAGVESVVLEARSRDYVEARIRAGVLEQGTVDLLDGAGVGERMRREGIVHHGIALQFADERHRIPLSELAGGRSIVDLRADRGRQGPDRRATRDGAPAAVRGRRASRVHDLTSDAPRVTFRHEGHDVDLRCDAIAGCDGFHGVCRDAIPAGRADDVRARLPLRLARHPGGRRRRPATSSSTRTTSAASPS